MLGFGKSMIGGLLGGVSAVLAAPRPASAMMMNSTVKPMMNLTFKRLKHEYAPRYKRIRKAMKGKVPVRTGGSIKGNTLQYGQYGMRLKTEGTRMTAAQLKEADKVILREIKPFGGQLIRRLACNLAVCVKGNQTRMGKGKGAFDHWAVRVPTGKMLFEVRGEIHDKVMREAFRKAAAKLPGVCEVVTKESPIRVGLKLFLDKEPAPVDYKEKFNEKPSRKWANVVASEEDMYRMYRGR